MSKQVIYIGKLKGSKKVEDKELKLLDGCDYVSWKDGVKK